MNMKRIRLDLKTSSSQNTNGLKKLHMSNGKPVERHEFPRYKAALHQFEASNRYLAR